MVSMSMGNVNGINGFTDVVAIDIAFSEGKTRITAAIE